MIEKIRIQNFKNFQDTTIEGFKRINLFAGLNNSGKSNLLEAIALSLANHSQIFLLLKALRLGPDLKIDSPEFFFDDFFYLSKCSPSCNNIIKYKNIFSI